MNPKTTLLIILLILLFISILIIINIKYNFEIKKFYYLFILNKTPDDMCKQNIHDWIDLDEYPSKSHLGDYECRNCGEIVKERMFASSDSTAELVTIKPGKFYNNK